MTLTPGSKLGPYEILSAIGSGGMGEVWKARDTRLGRIVAIKKVKEQHSERFKQEARSIAALNHPNICQIFDIGDDYLVLEYVEGKPLSSPLPEQEAVRLAIQIATALEEAHQHGIIHRDLKPSNIMVTDKGTVKLLDFGLAKLYEQDASISSLPTEDLPATHAGAILGTVAYMSPEQAQGQPADARSDIFSFGLVLYEMLSGRRAFSGDSASETIAALLRDEPTPLKASPTFKMIVSRCLEKNPSDRYQTMTELRTALVKTAKEKVSVESGEPHPSIAVLPFADMSPGKDNEWFSDGLAEEIINALTNIPGLLVIARTSAFAFKGKNEDIRKIAEVLGVANILEGSVRKSGNHIRVTTQLIEASKGGHLWSERFDRDLTDIFIVQDEISQAIAEKLRVQLAGNQPLVKRPTENIEAYNLYLKGRYQLEKFTPKALTQSKNFYEQAIDIDPKYAQAWSALANHTFMMGGIYGYVMPEEAYSQCNHAIEKVLELDKTEPLAYGLSAALHSINYQWQEAEQTFKHAIELESKSSNDWVWIYYVIWFLLPKRRFDEAIKILKKVLERDPLSLYAQWLIAWYYHLTKQWDLTIKQCKNVLDLDPNYNLAYQYLGFTYFQIGKIKDGVKACEMASQIIGKGPWPIAFRAIAYGHAGMIEEAHLLLNELHELDQNSYVTPSIFTWIYCCLGDVDKGLDWFEKAIDKHDGLTLAGRDLAIYDPLRSHPRYKALLRKMNLDS